MSKQECLFCDFENPEKHKLILQDDLVYARWDNFPVSAGHAEVVPKRHIESFFELSDDELLAIFGMAKAIRENIMEQYNPDAFNLGINDGEAAGRTIHHMHLHLIPRYDGDVDSPRGGVRNIIPGKGDY
jgi:diadenosine tetraphosphate (Ap4A) HIT family hydrolase